MKFAVRDGFESMELKPPPKIENKKTPRRRRPHFYTQNLTLVNTREVDQLLPSSPCENTSEGIEGDLQTLSLEHSNGKKPHNSEMPSAPKRSRKVSFGDEVYNQLVNLTAPNRLESGSDDEPKSDLDTESNISEQMEDDEDDEDLEPILSYQGLLRGRPFEIDDNIECDEPQLHSRGQVTQIIIEKDEILFDTDEAVESRSEEYLTRPGQVVRMKSSGQWMEVREEIIDMDTSHTIDVTSQQDVTPRPRPLRSILKSIELRPFDVCMLLIVWFSYIAWC
jgi:hypothetical protein